MNPHAYTHPDRLHRDLTLRDLSDPSHGAHAMQGLLTDVVTALQQQWACSVRHVRNPPIVSVRDNYDRLGYDPADVTRDRRYTRYVSPTTMLRSHTSAEIPHALEHYQGAAEVDELIVVPGLVYRRDVVDRSHVGEPHQVDLWRIRDAAETSDAAMLDMIGCLVESVLPGAHWRTTEVTHPYTLGGREIEVELDGEWLELAECGRIHPGVLERSGLDPARWSGLALGMGLDRAVMLRKGLPDIRYLRSTDPRVASQLLDLEPWQHVSPLPEARRDISIVVDAEEDEETLGDRVRAALGEESQVLEAVEVLARTPYADLPDRARERLQILPTQDNLLLRIAIRPVDRTLTSAEANEIRNTIYTTLHEGPVSELV